MIFRLKWLKTVSLFSRKSIAETSADKNAFFHFVQSSTMDSGIHGCDVNNDTQTSARRGTQTDEFAILL